MLTYIKKLEETRRIEMTKNSRQKMVINLLSIDGQEKIGFGVWYFNASIGEWRPSPICFAVDRARFGEQMLPQLIALYDKR